MATFTTRTVTTTCREWAVPAAEPWGATADAIGETWHAAETAYRELHQVDRAASLPPDAIRFRVGDGQIVIAFTVEEATA